MIPIDFGSAIKGFAVIALVIGVVLGVAGTKGCEYLLDRTNVTVEWRRSS